ncbi:MAG: RHS repeat domain-containing protein, partial [Candidatus Rokuibacteriota bacterium]
MAAYATAIPRPPRTLTELEQATRRVYYLHADRLGSPELITDQDGNIAARLKHDPFGARIAAAPPATPGAGPPGGITLGFTGHQHDDELGLIDMKGRIYDPTQARFLTPDPFIANQDTGQVLNRYSYALNNPLRYIDPMGFQAEAAAGAIWIVDEAGARREVSEDECQRLANCVRSFRLPEVVVRGTLPRAAPPASEGAAEPAATGPGNGPSNHDGRDGAAATFATGPTTAPTGGAPSFQDRPLANEGLGIFDWLIPGKAVGTGAAKLGGWLVFGGVKRVGARAARGATRAASAAQGALLR